MDNLNDLSDDTFERFVLGQMPDEELDAFLAYLTLHPEVQADITAARARILTLRGSMLLPPKERVHLWVWLAVALVGLGLIVLFFMREKSGPSPKTPPIQPPKTSEKPLESPHPDIAQIPKTLKQSKPRKAKRLVAAYLPNKTLELQINSGLRGSEFQFQIVEPSSKQVLKQKSGQVKFRLSGTLRAAVMEPNTSFQVLIFDNQPTNLETRRYSAAFQIPLTEKGIGETEFQLEQNTKLPIGLFYFIIEEESSSDWYYVGKFRVE